MGMDEFLELSHDTIIADAKVTYIGATELFVEKSDPDGTVRKAVCTVPGYKWESEDDFSEEEINKIKAMIKDQELLIFSGVIL